jgi:hypothetical protein
MRLLGLALFLPAFAWADTVVLTDGQEVEGIVTEEPGRVTVTLDFGTVSFERSEVADIRRNNTGLHELESKRARLAPEDAAGRLALARWAEANGLAAKARELYAEVLSLRPSDEEAHAKLGHRLHEGKWMEEDDYLAATGHVRYGGQWVSAGEAEELERQAQERKAWIEEARIARLEAQLAQQKARLEELEKKPEEEEDRDRSMILYGGYWPFYRLYSPPSVELRGRFRTANGSVTLRAGGLAKGQTAPGQPASPPAKPAAPRGIAGARTR